MQDRKTCEGCRYYMEVGSCTVCFATPGRTITIIRDSPACRHWEPVDVSTGGVVPPDGTEALLLIDGELVPPGARDRIATLERERDALRAMFQGCWDGEGDVPSEWTRAMMLMEVCRDTDDDAAYRFQGEVSEVAFTEPNGRIRGAIVRPPANSGEAPDISQTSREQHPTLEPVDLANVEPGTRVLVEGTVRRGGYLDPGPEWRPAAHGDCIPLGGLTAYLAPTKEDA